MEEDFTYINNSMDSNWEYQQQVSSDLNQDFTDIMRSDYRYSDPSEGTNVAVSDSYEYAWKLDSGEYVATNDPYFSPYSEYGMGGEQLERAW